jgi:hypothetical protein
LLPELKAELLITVENRFATGYDDIGAMTAEPIADGANRIA